eukprot:4762883-Pleurochrysis_carterae.AAC.1
MYGMLCGKPLQLRGNTLNDICLNLKGCVTQLVAPLRHDATHARVSRGQRTSRVEATSLALLRSVGIASQLALKAWQD